MLLPLGIIWLMQITLSPHYLVAIPFNLWALGSTVFFATAVGLSFSLRFASSVKAIGATLATLLFVGGGYMFCCCLPMFFAAGPNGEESMLMFIACIPFLQGAPSPLVFFTMEGEMSDSEFTFAAIDYLFGTIGYAIAATVMTVGLVGNFDRIVGRVTGDRPRRPVPPRSVPPSSPEGQVPAPLA